MERVARIAFLTAFLAGLVGAANAQSVSSGSISGPSHLKKRQQLSQAVVRAPHSAARPSAVASRRSRSDDLVTGSISKKPQ